MNKGNHSDRHEELRGLGIRLLSYMGISDIRKEYTVNVDALPGQDNRKSYRIDIVGFRNNNTDYDDKSNIVFVEIGNNHFDKINHLRGLGYLVFVIPYSEKEEEFYDDNKMLRIMIEGNKHLKDLIYKMVLKWNVIGDENLIRLQDKEKKINKLIEDIELKYSEIERRNRIIMDMGKKMSSSLSEINWF